VFKVEILRWGNCTYSTHLGPLSVHVGPLLTVVPSGDHWTTEYLFIYSNGKIILFLIDALSAIIRNNGN